MTKPGDRTQTYDRRLTRLAGRNKQHALYTAAVRQQGCTWYDEANAYAEQLAATYRVSLEVACAVISAFSPRTPWKRNKKLAALFLEGNPTPGLQRNREAAEKATVMAFDALTGQKTNAFARNIYGDDSVVTLDVWMARAAGLDPDKKITPKKYRELSRAVINLARRHKVSPPAMQAIIWIVVRGSAQ